MIRTLLTAAFLFALWLLMSGVYIGLVIGFGVASVLLSVIIFRRMDYSADADRLEVRLRPFGAVAYFFWLLVEIFKSTWTVTKAIMSPDMALRQHYFRIPRTQTTDLGQTIFANSITLTPGTVTVDTLEDCFWVHAVCYSDDDPDALADMDSRVTRTEASA